MKIDLFMQKEILLACERAYPAHLNHDTTISLMNDMGNDKFYGTLIYLHEKGLIHADYEYSPDQKTYNHKTNSVRITAEGLDRCFHMTA